MEVKASMPLQPRPELRVLVGSVVVHDQVKIEVPRRHALQPVQETDELLMAVAQRALADDPAVEDVERGKQGRRAMTLVVVRLGGSVPRCDRQARLGPLESLDL